MDNEINWKKVTKSSKDGAGGPSTFLMDEICCFDFGFGDWKPELWYEYNEEGELIYNKFTDEEE